MTDAEIDALSGVELARAVAEANHAVETKDTMRFRYWVWPGGRRELFNRYRPDCHIDQAWELAEQLRQEGHWFIHVELWPPGIQVELFELMEWSLPPEINVIGVRRALAQSTEEMCAEICRAYLKARGKEPL